MVSLGQRKHSRGHTDPMHGAPCTPGRHGPRALCRCATKAYSSIDRRAGGARVVERARVRLIRASQSAELREVFRQLSELEGPDGPKFSRRILMELAARVVGRAYEPMLLELCHLARAALLADRHAWSGRTGSPAAAGFEWLFWGVEKARTSAFRAAFAHGAASVGFYDTPHHRAAPRAVVSPTPRQALCPSATRRSSSATPTAASSCATGGWRVSRR